MGTETCKVCSGMCYLPSGQYENCYSCGGRGYGATTDTPCMACGGSGKSTTEIQNACWNCHGLGTVHSPDSVPAGRLEKPKQSGSGKPTTTSNSNGTAKATKKSKSLSDTIGGISLLIAAIVAFAVYQEKSDLGTAFGVGVVTFLGTGLALFVAYYALKVAFEILKALLIVAFWGFVVLMIANFLGAEWATNFLARF
jgi:hypothetical protein